MMIGTVFLWQFLCNFVLYMFSVKRTFIVFVFCLYFCLQQDRVQSLLLIENEWSDPGKHTESVSSRLTSLQQVCRHAADRPKSPGVFFDGLIDILLNAAYGNSQNRRHLTIKIFFAFPPSQNV